MMTLSFVGRSHKLTVTMTRTTMIKFATHNCAVTRALVCWLALVPFISIATFAQSAVPQSRQPATPPSPTETVDGLAARLNAHISQPRFAPAAWGVKIVSLDSGKTIFEHNPQKYF